MVKTHKKKMKNKLKRAIRRNPKPTEVPEVPNTPTLPDNSRFGRSIHDGAGPLITSQGAMDFFDEAIQVDPNKPKHLQPMWFMKALDNLSLDVVETIRNREEAGYQVSLKLPSDLDRARDGLILMDDRDVHPTVVGFGNEPDLHDAMTAKEYSIMANAQHLPSLMLLVHEKTGMRISNAGMSSVRHAMGDWGKMHGDMLGGLPSSMVSFHSYGNFDPHTLAYKNVKSSILRNMGLSADTYVALEETSVGFIGKGKDGGADKIEKMTGEVGGDFYYDSALLGTDLEIYIGHFLLEYHGVNALYNPKNPESAGERQDALRMYMKRMVEGDKVISPGEYILQGDNRNAKEVDLDSPWESR